MQKLAFRRDLPAILKFEINIIMDRELPFQEMYREPPLHVHYYIAATADNIFDIKICLMIIAACLILISLAIFVPPCWSLLSKMNCSIARCKKWRDEQIEKAEKSQNS